MKDIIVSVIVLILAVITVYIVIDVNAEKKELVNLNNEIQVETSSYNYQKKQLQNELEALKATKVEIERGRLSLLLVFAEINELFMEEIVPMLNDNNISATLCITENNLPVETSALTLYDINYLLASGWQTAMLWDGSEDIDAWYLNVTRLMSEVGVEIPKVICIDHSLYNDEFKDSAVELGFTDIIINAPSTDERVSVSDERITVTNGHPWYTTSSADSLNDLDFDGEAISFFVGTTGDEMAYEELQFEAMLDSAVSKRENGEIVITTPDGAKRQAELNKDAYEASYEVHNNKIKEIEDKIKELDDKIDDTYDAYFGDEN